MRLLLATGNTDGGTDDAPDRAGGSSTQTVEHVVRRSAELRAIVAARASTTVTVGLSGEEQQQRSQAQYGGSFAFNDRVTARRESRAVFAELLERRGRTTVTAGARIDDSPRFGTFDTYRLAARRDVVAGVHLRGSVGTAFREPSFFESFAAGFTRGNPALRPERTLTWEAAAGYRDASGRVAIETIVFDQRFRDLVDYDGTAPAGTPHYQNIAAASARGVEIELRAVPRQGVWADAAVTMLRTRVDSGGFSSAATAILRKGQSLVRRPDITLSAGVGVRPSARGGADVRVSHVGSREDRRFTNSAPFTQVVTLAAYTLVDLSGDLAVFSRADGTTLRLTGRLSNATDVEYETVAGYRTPRRMVLLGLRAEF
jgi:outer membrane cobalamin receptor